jgi:nucleotide-binding universal stress UspA family protein
MEYSIRSIVHPTDFSHLSIAAFAHALRIGLAAKCKLHALHINRPEADEKQGFPHVQRLLVQWGLLAEGDPPSAIASKLGLGLQNITLDPQNPADGIVRFLDQNACDLVVLATRGREGLDRWLEGSVAEQVFRQSSIATLFVPRGARSFVDQVTGDLKVWRVLVPVDHAPAPDRAIRAARCLAHLLAGANVTIQLLHVGKTAPVINKEVWDSEASIPITIRYGNVVQTIVDAAVEYDADFICRPTAGHHGILDAMRGSTTERVIRHAPCPVLAVPAT